MKNFDFKKDLLPHIIALAALFIILSAFFAPVYSGKTLRQSDIVQHKGASKAIVDYREKNGEEPLWTNSLFGGMPAFMVSTNHTGEFFTKVFKNIRNTLPQHINLLFFGGVCFYIFMIIAGFTPTIAFSASISFLFSAYTLVTLEAGHNSKIETLSFIPLVLAGIYLVFNKRYLMGAVILVIATSMLVNSGHYQIMFYAFLAVAIASLYYIVNIIKNKDFAGLGKIIGVFAIAILIAIGNNFSKLFTSLDYLQNHSTRGKKELVDNKKGSTKSSAMDYDYAFSWSYGVLESSTWVIPYYYGGASSEDVGKNSETYKVLKKNNVPAAQAKNFVSNLPTYWGDQPFTSGPTYFGAVIFLFFILSFFLWDNKLKWYILSSIVFIWFLSLGKNFSSLNYFLFDNLPGMNKFRAVMMASSIAHIFYILMAMIGVYQVFKKENLDNGLLMKGIGGSLGFIILLILIGLSQDFSGAVDAQLANQPGWILDAIREDRKGMLLSDSFRTIIFIVLGAVAVFLKKSNKMNPQQFSIAITLLILVDLWGVSKRYINEDNFSKSIKAEAFKTSKADEFILRDNSNYRVFNIASNTFNENNTSYVHQSIGGYRPTKMQRYQDIIERRLQGEKQMLIGALKQTQNIDALSQQIFPKMTVTNMLNGKYLIYNPNAQPLVNNSALGNAWFVKNIKKVNSPNEEIDALNTINPKETAVIDVSNFDVSKENFTGSGTIKLIDWDLNYLKYEYNSTDDAFIVFSENYYNNGWIVTLDGNEIDHVRVNYILRGLEAKKGKHTLEFKYKPDNYYTNNRIASISSVLSFILIGAGLFIGFKNRKEDDE